MSGPRRGLDDPDLTHISDCVIEKGPLEERTTLASDEGAATNGFKGSTLGQLGGLRMGSPPNG